MIINVAVMGAGLSGLSCAITLEHHGIKPTVFEKRSEVGDRFVNCEILLSSLSRPIKNPIKYFSEKYNINLKVQNNINKLIIHSPEHSAVITGTLGHTNLRGRAKNSFEKQLAEQLDSKIKFNSNKSYEELLHEYTHVVLATGDAAYADKISNYDKKLTVRLKGANIEGSFEDSTVHTWLNNDFAPQGYSYLIPISNKEANVVIAFPDNNKNSNIDIDILWSKFQDEVSRVLGYSFSTYDNFDIEKYIIGICRDSRIGNTFLTGNNFGSIMPFLGFGQLVSIFSGIYAALDICGEGDYEKMVIPLRKSFQESLNLRKAMEKMSNDNFDFLVDSLKGGLGQRVFTGKLNYLKYLSKILEPIV